MLTLSESGRPFLHLSIDPRNIESQSDYQLASLSKWWIRNRAGILVILAITGFRMTDVLPRLAHQSKSLSFDERRLTTYPKPVLGGEGECPDNGFQPSFTTVLPSVDSDGYTLTTYTSYIADPRKLILHYL